MSKQFPARERDSFVLTAMSAWDNQFSWHVNADLFHKPFNIGPTSPSEIQEKSKVVRQLVVDLALAVDKSRHYPGDLIRHKTEELYEAGLELTKAAFVGPNVKRLNDLLDNPKLKYAELVLHEDRTDWPVEFCVFDLEKKGRRFLGEVAATFRRVPENSTNQEFAEVDSWVAAPPVGELQVGYAEDDQLPSACRIHHTPGGIHEEIHVFKPLVGDVAHNIDFLDELDPDLAPSVQDAFRRWLTTSRDVMHFNSHAIETDTARLLRVRKGATVGTIDLAVEEGFEFNGSMLAFLNACSSVHGAVKWEGSLAGIINSMGAGVVACTTGPVHDDVATVFARHFYEQLAKPGTTAGEALVVAKRATSDELHHPLANVYTLMGNESYKLRMSGIPTD